ncbi:D-glycero-beta-D-manno-heptose-1,7-bisphosphate 7-phosphatase [Chromatium weissei]|nr:D-glycero-beta-D-manno-heptose-1,7-bisphosphate 7-phosphatase [Chromatium weissei]
MLGCSERVIILDRDGVINEDSNDYIKSVAEWKPLPRSIEAIARLSHAGYRIAIASNQSGIGRGLFPLSELNAMHQLLRELVAAQGGKIEMIAFCPHAPNAQCECRKPNIGLLTEIANRMNINLIGVPFIGDSISDVIAARRVGAIPWLVMSGKGQYTLAQLHAQNELCSDLSVCSDLCAAVSILLNREN